MIEIYAIYKFCKLLGRKLREKNRAPLLFQILFVCLWFIFEFLGFFIYAVLFASSTSGQGGAYLFGLLGAASSVAIIFLMVDRLSTKSPFREPGFPVELHTAPQELASAETSKATEI